MGTFAETAIVHYRLSFANQGKQTSISLCSKQTKVFSVSAFYLQKTNGSRRLPLVPIKNQRRLLNLSSFHVNP
jgi:hypothetical protein